MHLPLKEATKGRKVYFVVWLEERSVRGGRAWQWEWLTAEAVEV